MKLAYSVLPLLVAMPMSGVAASPSAYSWGKAGVSRTEYESDAIACSLPAASRDVAADRETRDYVQGANALDRENNMPSMARPPDEEGLIARANRNVLLRRMYGPDRKVDALQAKLQGEVEACLTERGYTRFRLSRSQIRQLRRLRTGSQARRDFLHSLGSDADIVSTQRVNMDSRPD